MEPTRRDKNGRFKNGIAKRTKRMLRRWPRSIGPDRFVSGNSYWQSHAVLETQESIVARSDAMVSLPDVLVHPAVVLVFFWLSFRDFSVRQERAYVLIYRLYRIIRSKLNLNEITQSTLYNIPRHSYLALRDTTYFN